MLDEKAFIKQLPIAELLRQREALAAWVRAMESSGGGATLMKLALSLIEEEIKRRGLADEDI